MTLDESNCITNHRISLAVNREFLKKIKLALTSIDKLAISDLENFFCLFLNILIYAVNLRYFISKTMRISLQQKPEEM